MKKLCGLEKELRFMESDKEHRSYRDVIDAILDKDKSKREHSQG